MASTLQDMRKEAGYKTAREFAEAIDVPVATYARYEQSPTKIPIKNAWHIADVLGCSIDAVVGREHVDVDSMRGEVQRFYDDLSDDSRALFDSLSQVLKERDEQQARQRVEAERRRVEEYMRYYEKLLFQSADGDGELSDILVFGSPAQQREAYLGFVKERACNSRIAKAAPLTSKKEAELDLRYGFTEIDEDGEVRETGLEDASLTHDKALDLSDYCREVMASFRKEDEKTVSSLMEAYDRVHQTTLFHGDMRLECATIDPCDVEEVRSA